jgi:hypothetical protein
MPLRILCNSERSGGDSVVATARSAQEETMKAMKQILVAASLVVISATAPVVEAQQGAEKAATEANTVKADLPKIDESLHGTEYVNRTGKFSLTLPPEWIINADLRQRPVTLAGLSSSDKTRFAIVEQKEYPGSLASYKELTMAAARITLSNFEELSQSSATIDGKRAILALYRGNIPVPPYTSVEFVTAFISRSDNNFTKVTAWCAEPLFHDMQRAFEKLVTSYRSSARFTSDGNR